MAINAKAITDNNWSDDPAALERSALRKALIRIVPFLGLCYFFAYLDRVNVGIAALQMNGEIRLSSAAFGLGSGAFFLGYFLFEIPSNLLLERFGARRWLARIMVTWGLISALMVFAAGPVSFVVLRFLLGAAEAGFYPGVILYITYFFPAAHRARIIAVFTLAVPLSQFIGSPMSTAILQMQGAFGLHGWQWLFLLESIPSVLLGLLCLLMLSDSPAKASWLTRPEQAWLEAELQAERAKGAGVPRQSVLTILLDRRVLAGCVTYGSVSAAAVALGIWQPQIIKAYGLTNMQTGLLNSIPFGVASAGMLLWGRMADRSRRPLLFTVLPLLAIMAGLACAGVVHTLLLAIVSLSVVITAIYAFKGPFWALATSSLPPATLAIALAQMNAVGGLGSFLGTSLMGVVKDATGSFALAMWPLIGLAVAGAVCAPLISGAWKPLPAERSVVT